MKEERYFYVPDASHQNELPKEEAQHALKVLRMQVGDEMFLMDGQRHLLSGRDLSSQQQALPLQHQTGSASEADVERSDPSRHRTHEDDGPHGMDDREMHRDRL